MLHRWLIVCPYGFVFSDIVRRTPSANPATEAMKNRMAVRPGGRQY